MPQDKTITLLIKGNVTVKGFLTTLLERRVAHRLHWLEQVMDRVVSSESLELQPEFDDREWVSK